MTEILYRVIVPTFLIIASPAIAFLFRGVFLHRERLIRLETKQTSDKEHNERLHKRTDERLTHIERQLEALPDKIIERLDRHGK